MRLSVTSASQFLLWNYGSVTSILREYSTIVALDSEDRPTKSSSLQSDCCQKLLSKLNREVNMENKNFSSADLMKFLKGFQSNMESKMEDTKKMIEDTNKQVEAMNRIIDGRLEIINSEIKKVNHKMVDNEVKNDELNRRMDVRLTLLEQEMKMSAGLRRISLDLKKKEENLNKIPVEKENGKTVKTFQMDGHTKKVHRKGG